MGVDASSPASTHGTPPRDDKRRRVILAVAIVLAAVAGWFWIWPDRGIGEFLDRLAVKQHEASAVMDELMPQGVGVIEEQEPGETDARTACQLHRLRLPIFYAMCADGCPTWSPGDPVTVTRSRPVVDAPARCAGWMDHLGRSGSSLREIPPQRDWGARICGFRGTYKAASIDVAVYDTGETKALRVTAAVS